MKKSSELGKQGRDWKPFIDAAEQHIINAAKQVEFKEYLRNLTTVSKWWEGTCAPFLQKSECCSIATFMVTTNS